MMFVKCIILLAIAFLLLQNSHCDPGARTKRLVKSPTQIHHSTGSDQWRKFYKKFDYMYHQLGESLDINSLYSTLEFVIEKLSDLDSERTDPDVQNEINELRALSDSAKEQGDQEMELYYQHITLFEALLNVTNDHPNPEFNAELMNLSEKVNASQESLLDTVNNFFEGANKFNASDIISELESQGARVYMDIGDPSKKCIYFRNFMIMATVNTYTDISVGVDDINDDEDATEGEESGQGGVNHENDDQNNSMEDADGRNGDEGSPDDENISEEQARGDETDDSNVDEKKANDENNDENNIDGDSTEENSDGEKDENTTDGANADEENEIEADADGDKNEKRKSSGEW